MQCSAFDAMRDSGLNTRVLLGFLNPSQLRVDMTTKSDSGAAYRANQMGSQSL